MSFGVLELVKREFADDTTLFSVGKLGRGKE